MRENKLLFIDDDRFFSQVYTALLEELCTVVTCTDALSAVNIIQLTADQFICIVIDMMMPSPRGWEMETEDGIYTGVKILKSCRQAILDSNLPVVVLTNHPDVSRISRAIQDIGFLSDLVLIQPKSELYPPSRLQKIVIKAVKKHNSSINLKMPVKSKHLDSD